MSDDKIEWVLVPRVPTDAMREAVRQVGGTEALAWGLAAWPTLLAAAPLPTHSQPVAWLGSNGSLTDDWDRATKWRDRFGLDLQPLYAAPPQARVSEALEATQDLLVAMLHETRPREEIEAQIIANRQALGASNE